MSNTTITKNSYIDAEIEIDILEECKDNLNMIEKEDSSQETLFDVIIMETLMDVGKLYSFEELCKLVYEKRASS